MNADIFSTKGKNFILQLTNQIRPRNSKLRKWRIKVNQNKIQHVLPVFNRLIAFYAD